MNTHAYTPMHIQNLINRTAMEANILPLNCYTIIITIIYRRFFMSHKTVICFAIWTSFLSALFNHFYTVYFGSFGVPWIMFVCMAIYFGMGGAPKQVPGMILSAFCGLAWGQFDFILINFFGSTCHMSAEMASFVAILVGTAITMYIHIKLLGATPLGFMPFIFAGVCLTFSQGGSNVAGLAFTLFVGIILAMICGLGLTYCTKKFDTPQITK